MLVSARSLLYLGFLSLSVVIYAIPLATLGWLLPSPVLGRIGRSWSQANLWGLRWLCGLRVRVHGIERIPARNGIVMAKHQSAWETIALRAILPPDQIWVLKRELLWIPFFGWALAPYRPIAINRGSGRAAVRKLLERGAYWLAKGRWIIIFPEGTRVAPSERRRYGPGGGMLAERTCVPVVPVAHNAGVFWRRRALKKYPGTIDVVIGEPIATAGRKAQEISREVEEWIERTVADLPQKPDGGSAPR
jgi:1-acyl-sn-glycerol-3-phosphate acyltransferase